MMETFSAPTVRLGQCGLSLQQSRATFVRLLISVALWECSRAGLLHATLHTECMNGCSPNTNHASQQH